VKTELSTPSVALASGQVPRPLATARTISAMMLREIVTTHGRSPGGYLWAILEPVAAITLLSVAFSLAFAAPSLGVSFPLFYATAYLPYMLFHDVSNKIASALNFSRPLMAYPAVTYLDAVLARFILNLATHIMVFVLVMAGILLTMEHRAVLDLPGILLALAMAAALALGVGTLNCYLTMSFPAYERLWMIANRPLFILSGVFFLYEDIPAQFRDILWFNPLYHVTGAMRSAFYPTYDAAYVSPTYVFGFAALALVFGLVALRNSHGELLG
jgi:capsular polysaccharide transport system permease protein